MGNHGQESSFGRKPSKWCWAASAASSSAPGLEILTCCPVLEWRGICLSPFPSRVPPWGSRAQGASDKELSHIWTRRWNLSCISQTDYRGRGESWESHRYFAVYSWECLQPPLGLII